MEVQIVKTIYSQDGKSRIHIICREDRHFGFTEERQAYDDDYDGDDGWTGVWTGFTSYHSPICSSAETAEREARTRVSWLVHIPS